MSAQGPAIVRAARPADLARVAELHATCVTDGFLPTLGQPFLRRLHRRCLLDTDAALLVAECDARVTGFLAAVVDVGRFYKRFLIRDGVVAATLAAPRLAQSTRRILETLRYPGTTAELPAAEILAVAVDPAIRARGVGRSLVASAQRVLASRSVAKVKVVAAATNARALNLYEQSGFVRRAEVEVHAGTSSVVLVWTASPPS
jgi:ribosomal protein S18 acetylase RimI-like enzyme